MAGTLTVITSRRRLTGLKPDLHIDVEPFTTDEAEQLLARSAAGVGIGRDRTAHHRVAWRCGYLPLALSVVVGQIAARPGWTVTDHADRLDERHRHWRLDTEVELALQLSYQDLPEQQKALLREMAAHPGPDLDNHAGAALLDTDPDTAATQLRQLAAESMVQEPVAGRYMLHDLVRAYAVERAHDVDRPADRQNALSRVFDHYLCNAAAAMDALYPAERHRRPALQLHRPARPELDDPKNALLWLDVERATLVAVCRFAARNGWPKHAVWLAGTLYMYLDNGDHPSDAFTVHTDAQYAAGLLGDGIAETAALAKSRPGLLATGTG